MTRGAAFAILLLAGCGAPRDYMGIDLARSPAGLALVARLAQGGDKGAQLAPGRVVPIDSGPVQPGLETARERLRALAYRATAPNLTGSACLQAAKP